MADKIPLHQRPVVYSVPAMNRIEVQHNISCTATDGTTLLLDIYPPLQQSHIPSPVILFIHGGPISPERNMRETQQYRSWGALAAASGMVGVTFTHRYHAPGQLQQSFHDVNDTLTYIRNNAVQFGLDPQRVCLWTCSGGGPLIAPFLHHPPDYLKCLISYYAILDVQQVDYLRDTLAPEQATFFSALSAVTDSKKHLPLFIARAGLDHPTLNQTIDSFASRTLAENWPIEIYNHPQGHHGFDVADDDERSRYIIARSLDFAGRYLELV